ncbi:MAG: tetratricopeptide repeat protein [Alphaproteobacteria bacterium]|jgi:predicted O-linked N-acetylglucosamine transferase (SPINDLY family)|nr:tetratricopeptide repeat protein [Alphaproteobacteria bacterium]
MTAPLPPRAASLLGEAEARLAAGDAAGGLDCCRRAARIDPRHAALQGEAGAVLLRRQMPGDALPYLSKAAAFDPRNPDRQANLAVARAMAGQVAEAMAACDRALALRPDHLPAGLTRARLLVGQGNGYAADQAYRRVLRHHAGNAALAAEWQDMLIRLVTTAQPAMADHPAYMAAARAVLAATPARAAIWARCAATAMIAGRPADAVRDAGRALRIDPGLIETRMVRSAGLLALGNAAGALADMAVVASLAPADWTTYLNRGAIRDRTGDTAGALNELRHAVALAPDRLPAWSNLLAVAIKAETDAAELAARAFHRAAGRLFGDRAPAVIAGRGDRLRVGYVSPDLRHHSCAWFIEPLVERHDPRRVETFAYAEVPAPDAVTSRLQRHFAHWQRTDGLDDEALARRIADDRIDVLVDLAGHFHGNRLAVFARRPAPVQASWLGYNATTGLDAMDWKLVDDWLAPAGQPLDWFAEGLWRLPRLSHCWRPSADAPVPRRGDGPLTLGSFNNLAKLSGVTLAAWAEILRRLPGARLLLKADQAADRVVQARLRARFAAHGVAEERIAFMPYAPSQAEHLALYAEIDVALDPFPYNGTTTTCEALWMGVPVVALAGQRLVARVGASLLGATGLDELVAADVDGYVARAVAVAGDRERRAGWRHGLRALIAGSPLRDETGFARAMEQAYAGMVDRRDSSAVDETRPGRSSATGSVTRPGGYHEQ